MAGEAAEKAGVSGGSDGQVEPVVGFVGGPVVFDGGSGGNLALVGCCVFRVCVSDSDESGGFAGVGEFEMHVAGGGVVAD